MQALVATAHKIARTVYHLLKDKTPYQDSGADAYEQKAKERDLAHLRKKAAKLGYTLTATDSVSPAPPPALLQPGPRRVFEVESTRQPNASNFRLNAS